MISNPNYARNQLLELQDGRTAERAR